MDERPIHAAPRAGSCVMACCGRTPFEVPPDHRISTRDDQVTCAGAQVSVTGAIAAHLRELDAAR